MTEEILWVEKYRPKTVEECILPDDLLLTFTQMVSKGMIPNMLLYGSAGIGKTTVAKALASQLGYDVLYINGSDEGRYLDTLRNKVKQFASSVSFTEKRKLVLIDEADNMTSDGMDAMRAMIEAVSKNCSFILTCNFVNRISDPLRSRCSMVEFKLPSDQKGQIALKFFKRVCTILKENEIEFDKSVIAELVQKYMPDWRRVLNELQRYSLRGPIDSGILSTIGDVEITTLARMLGSKNFKEVRTWVASNPHLSLAQISRQLYEASHDLMDPNSVPQAVLIMADYQFKEAFCMDREINTMACMVELMASVTWK